MRFLTPLLTALSALSLVCAAPQHAKTSVFLLAGDSTTAPQTAGGGGWGNGFKNDTLIAPSFATNYGVNGRTTASYVSDGYWATILNETKSYTDSGKKVYVTIQFGHNDQKLANFTETFKENLARMVGEVGGAGGVPVLVTPLSRRNYNADGTINDKLADWAGYTLSVAEATGTYSIDLLEASITYLEAIGEPAARRLDLVAGDATHLNVNGSKVFGRMVSDLLVAAVPGVNHVTRPDRKLSKLIREGVAVY